MCNSKRRKAIEADTDDRIRTDTVRSAPISVRIETVSIAKAYLEIMEKQTDSAKQTTYTAGARISPSLGLKRLAELQRNIKTDHVRFPDSSRSKMGILFCNVGLLLIAAVAQATVLYVSGLSTNTSLGVYAYSFDADNADQPLSSHGRLVAADMDSPHQLVVHEDALYAMTETDDGLIRAYAITGADGSLELLNTASSKGGSPSYGVVRHHGLYAANYMGGSISFLPLGRDGRLSNATRVAHHTDPPTGGRRQERAHAHAIEFVTPQWAVATDLGTDELFVYDQDLHAHQVIHTPPGTGPRHLAVHPHAPIVYVISELSTQLLIYALHPATGRLTEHAAPVPLVVAAAAATTPSAVEAFGAALAITPDGRYLYATVRGTNLVAMFAIHPVTYELTSLGAVSSQGEFPRSASMDVSGRFLVVGNERSNSVVVFTIDPGTGALTPRQRISHPEPSCVQFWPATSGHHQIDD
ncbi:Lactonase, 7-bladed beta-propeller-domain-containing protein [Dichotomocladium elegans]|nr:Lactonase, 7-bladed beta-propeller-domain-containing protein [Dichotomocladium elegans]